MAFYFIVCNTGIWIWLEEMLISSNMHGAILLLNNYYCSAAMIEVCLFKKICDSMGSRATNHLLFLIQSFNRYL